MQSLVRFAKNRWVGKRKSVGFRWLRFLPRVPFPVRLTNGCWWLARNDACGAAILSGSFELIEQQFMQTYLRPGMTVLDIGAHHGFYTLLASRRVGTSGRVIAFEPSPRETKFLNRHVRLNRCSNVTIVTCALGSAEGTGTLFLVEGKETGCNSLRPPEVTDAMRQVTVPVHRVDDILEELSIEMVDAIKLDAEGGELEILKGAGRLLEVKPRPLILAEVQDLRTRPWGYKSNEIIRYLRERGFQWFRPLKGGLLGKIDEDRLDYDENFVAIPEEIVGDAFSRLPAHHELGKAALAASA